MDEVDKSNVRKVVMTLAQKYNMVIFLGSLMTFLIGIVVAVLVAWAIQKNGGDDAPQTQGSEWVLVKGYSHVEPGTVTCQAVMPECGYCPGEVREKQCFVKRGVDYEYFDESEYY